MEQIALGIPRLLEQSCAHGFAMDWVNYIPRRRILPAPSAADWQQGHATSPVGSYDAIRVYYGPA